MNQMQEIEQNLTKYIETVKRLVPSGKKFTVINPYSAFVFGFNSENGKFTLTSYTVDQDKQLLQSPIQEFADIDTAMILNDWLDLSNKSQAFPYASNFIDAPFETHEIFEAIRMINIQVLKINTNTRISEYEHTIMNIFPGCLFSEISFKPCSTTNVVNVNIKIVKDRVKFNHISELRANVFERSVKINYTEDNVKTLYDAFIKIYWEYGITKNV